MTQNGSSALPLREAKRALLAALLSSLTLTLAWAQGDKPTRPPHDAVAEAQTSRQVLIKRPEQKKTEHDRADLFDAPRAQPSSPVFAGQPKEGKISGFDFYRDPLNADQPNQNAAEIMRRSPTSLRSWRPSGNF